MKLYKDKHGNILTKENGTSRDEQIELKGACLSSSHKAEQNTEELIKRWNCHDELVEALTNINELITHPAIEADETMPQIIAIEKILNKVKEGK